MPSLGDFLAVGAGLFVLGLFGALMKRTAVAVLMGIELMLNAANLNLVAFAAFSGRISGQIFALFVIALAAAEVAVGLAILLSLFRSRATVRMDDIDLLKG
ncbi:MAG: NADH-quinone oxidoreductase subunit NuoK [Thermaerobacter sp.]|jgi:NADH-quinone oxidoreductase subunit K|nr:NADH-quinone oxidoreductase subunit NuoK [Thermaerobacter sp.]MDA8146284.1 NADH-quinone oxidoreductase subunit NuoK [Thermaerobacter sp.]